MGWNPSPQVAAARDFGKKFGKKIVIILSIDSRGQLEYASYGETKALCGHAKTLASAAFDGIVDAHKD